MKTNALEKLQEANDLMKQAERLVNEARDSNSSLRSKYGYSLQIIEQELNQFSDNSRGYLSRNTTLEEIIESEGRKWFDDEKSENEGDKE